jgi:hypothetical protein
VHFVPFSPRALVEATQPVYAQLERDPATKRFLEQIQAMDASPDPAPKCTATQTTQARDASTLDGVYHMYTSKKDLARQDDVAVADATPENWGDWYLVIDRGRFVWTQQNPESCTWAYGTAILKGGQITWNVEDGGGISPTNSLNKPGERFVFKSRLYRGTLTLEAIEPADFTTEHWTRKSDRPSQDVFFHRCPPPAEAQVG